MTTQTELKDLVVALRENLFRYGDGTWASSVKEDEPFSLTDEQSDLLARIGRGGSAMNALKLIQSAFYAAVMGWIWDEHPELCYHTLPDQIQQFLNREIRNSYAH